MSPSSKPPLGDADCGAGDSGEATRQVFRLESTPIPDGTTVIEASAGTGKTYCVTGLVLRLLLEKKVSGIGHILVVTFTVAATDELVHRIRDALALAHRVLAGDAAPPDPFFRQLAQQHGGGDGLRILRQARLELDDLMVATLHGFAKRILEQNAFESGLPFRQDFLEDAAQPLLEAAQDFWRQVFYRADPLETAIAAYRHWTPKYFLDDFETYNRHPNTDLLPKRDLETVRQELAAARRALTKSLATAGAIGDLGRVLSRVRFKKGSPLESTPILPLLGELEAFERRGEVAGLGAVEGLAKDVLDRQIYKKDIQQIAHLAIPRACQQLRDAVDNLEHAVRGAFLRRVRILFENHKARSGQLTFDDLLHRLHEALLDPDRRDALETAVRQQFEVALIDEFQDTDLVQYAIFRQLFAKSPLFLIGDPKQAIYRFRGADVFAYMKARNEARRVFTLDRNWRSAPALVEAVNALFSASPRAFVFPEIPFQTVVAALQDEALGVRTGTPGSPRLEAPRLEAPPLEAPLQWLWLPQMDNREAAGQVLRQAICDEIHRLLDSAILHDTAEDPPRTVEPGDIAILVRTNRQAQELRDDLQRSGIPAVLSHAGDVFHSDEMAELERLLEAIAEPTHAPRLRAAAATLLWGDDAPTLLALEQDDTAWQLRVETMVAYRRLWLRSGFMPMMQQLISQRQLKPRLLALHDGERRLTNLLHAVELLHQASHRQHLSPPGLLRWLDSERQRSSRDSESSELRLDSDAKAVQISTIHKSKGLEYNIVFCPYLWEPRSAPKKPVLAHVAEDRRVFDFGSENLGRHQGLAAAEQLAEELRLAYVAITRARWRCYVVWGKIGRAKGAATSALAALLHRPLSAPSLELEVSAAEWTAKVAHDMSRSFDGWQDGLRAFVKAQQGRMALRTVEPHIQAARRPLPEVATPLLASCSFPDQARGRLQPWSMVSFTSLSRPDAKRPAESPEHDDPAVIPPPAPQPRQGIFAFAQGRQAGHCLHHLLELCDLSTLQDDTIGSQFIESQIIELQIDASLKRYGLRQPEAHQGTIDPLQVVKDMLHRLAAAPLPKAGFSLGQVPRHDWRVEEKFYAPIQNLSGDELAKLFQQHGENRVAEQYASLLAPLQGVQLAGFLTGIIDLLFEHQGRWYLVDWKSNHLGDHLEDYDDEAIWQAMRHHHYVLQYHLYVFALHRYLGQRLQGYDYQQHFGGVYYVFLRGLAEPPVNGRDRDEAGSHDAPTDNLVAASRGFYYDRPPTALIDALDRAAEGVSR